MIAFIHPFLWIAALGAPATEGTVAAWTRMNAASITTSASGSTDSLTCEAEFAGKDSRIVVTIVQEGKTTKGTLMLVSGMLLAKDVPVPAGSELDMVDGCGITLQLATALLARGTAVPPLSIRGRREFDFTEPKDPLHVATATAEATIPAPWSVRGWAESGTTGAVRFDIVQSIPNVTESMHVTGAWEWRPTAPSFADAMPLAGWKVFKIGAREGGGFAVTPATATYATLGELRSASAQKP
ncbi:MAG TPA: hypothetical protein VJ826_11540 [Candidatus Polarisedimenticolaceae bacterium]|nr:hypothetical protein [Candidatus Polarisedimenticolaceae bacterium]